MNERELFVNALQIDDAAERLAYLDNVCAGNAELRDRVNVLLAALNDAQSYLEQPVVDVAATAADTPKAHTGDQVGPYKLLQLVGEGGMGSVWMAEQHAPVRRRIALKLIKPGMDSRQVLARFEAERQALSMMDHPNIARVLDASTTTGGTPYFVMELVKGQPITEYCDQNHLSPRERLELYLPVCYAIQHAHQKGVIHRDIKPSNVLVAEYDGRPVAKVIDFGVAKAVHQPLTDRTMFTGIGQIIGTLEYMSPEQARVNQLDVDTRSDVYSLGVLLYELLTGSTPFDRKRLREAALDELLRIIREEEPPRPSVKLSTSETLPSIAANRKIEPARLSTLVRGELDWIVMKALEKDRNRRYETAYDVACDIQRYLNDEQVTACPPTLGYRLRKFVRRNKSLMTTTGIVAVTLLLGFLVASWQAIKATRAERVAIAERDEKETARREALASAARAQAAADAERAAKESEAEERKRAEAAEKSAEEEAAVARTVKDFLLQDLLGLAGAHNQMQAGIAPDPDLKLDTLLERSLATLDQRFTDQPRPRAEVQAVLANAFFSIGRYTEAIPLAEQALQYRESSLGPENPATLDSMELLSVLYQLRGKCAEGELLIKRAWDISCRAQSPESPQSLAFMNNLAGLYQFCMRRYPEAEQLQSQHLEIARRVLGPEHRETILSIGALGGALHGLGRFNEAEALFKQSIELGSRVLGADYPNTLAVRNNLACLYRDEGKFSKAQTIFEDLFAAERRIRGPKDPNLLRVARHLAGVYQAQGRYADAEPLFLGFFESKRTDLGAAHDSTLDSLFSVVQVVTDSGNEANAQSLIYENLEFVRRDIPTKSLKLANALERSGLMLLRCRALDEAESVLRECLEIRRRTEPDAWPTLKSESILGEVLAAKGQQLMQEDAELAESLFAEAKTLLLSGYDGLKAQQEVAPTPILSQAFRRVLELFVLYGSFDQFEQMQSELATDTTLRAKYFVDACWRKAIQPLPDGEQISMKLLGHVLQPALALQDLEVDVDHAVWLAATGQIAEYHAFVDELWQRPRDPANARQAYLLTRLSLMTESVPSNAAEVLNAAQTAAAKPFAWHAFAHALALLRTEDYAGALAKLPRSACDDWCGDLSALARALALHGLGHEEEARAALERGRNWETHNRLDQPNILAPHDRIQGLLLLREARAKISH